MGFWEVEWTEIPFSMEDSVWMMQNGNLGRCPSRWHWERSPEKSQVHICVPEQLEMPCRTQE